jgi:hypothetical protein
MVAMSRRLGLALVVPSMLAAACSSPALTKSDATPPGAAGADAGCAMPPPAGELADAAVAAPQTPTPGRCGGGWCSSQLYGGFRGLWGASASDVWGLDSTDGVQHWDGTTWSRTELAGIGLTSIWGSGSTDVWVVGGAEIFHWDGNGWSQVNQATGLQLSLVGGTGPKDVWAFASPSALHWDGTAWTPVQVGQLSVRAMWGSGPNDLYLVGSDVVHWDGARFTPVFGDTKVAASGVWGSGASDVWVVGDGFIQHWDGAAWSKTDSPYTLRAVWGSGPTDVWIADDKHALRWDGAAWSPALTLSPDPQLGFTEAWGSGDDDVWATSGDVSEGIIHFDGVSWSKVPVPDQMAIRDGWSRARGDAWALSGGEKTLRWDGAAWAAGPPLPSGSGASAIWGSGADDVWAVGYRYAWHWNGAAWTTFPVGTDVTLSSVSGSGPDDVWAVGSALMHWDGVAWRDWTAAVCPTYLQPDGELRILSLATDDAWLFVSYPSDGVGLHWDGATWTPAVEFNDGPRGVWGSAVDDVWVLTFFGLAHFDGMAWSYLSEPAGHNRAIWGSRKDSVWIFSNDAGPQGHITHWNGTFWLSQTALSIYAGTSFGPDATWLLAAGGQDGFGTVLRRTPAQ